MTQYLVIRGERYIQCTADCVYQIHSVFESAINPNIQYEAFLADFLNHRKGINKWTPENWTFNWKSLTLASEIDGERKEWIRVPVCEHLYRPCWYAFIKQEDVTSLFK